MKDVRFYEEFENKRRKLSAGNVIAVIPENGNPDGSMEALGAVHYYKNSPVASTSVSRQYLIKNCRRISEERAREIHPELFRRLDEGSEVTK